MKSTWVHRVLIAAALAALAAGPTVKKADVEGPLGLVRIAGGGYRDARDAGREMEEALHRYEEMTGLSLPRHVRPLVLLVLPDQPWGQPEVEAVPSAKGVPWTLKVRGAYAEASPDIQVHLARLVLSLWSDNQGVPLEHGDWLAVGLAGNVSPGQRGRNRFLARQLVEEGRLATLETISTWNRIPDGPMMEKAACALAVGWMLAQPGGKGLATNLISELKQGRIPVGRVPALASMLLARDAEAAWLEEASRRDVVAAGGRPLSPFLLREFRQSLQAPAATLGLGGLPALPALSPRQLLELRKAPGADQAARDRAAAVQQIIVGAPPELVQAGLLYKAFFDKLPGFTPSFSLRGLLAEADRTLRRVEDDYAARTRYLDRFDEDGAGDPGSGGDLNRYVDEAEARFEAENAPLPKGASWDFPEKR